MERRIELVQRLIAAQKRADLPAMLACLDPDVEWIPLRAATEGAYRGHEGFERFIVDTSETFGTFEIDVELREVGEHVVAWGTIRVQGVRSGIATDIPTGGIFTFRDGRVLRWHDLGSREKAFEAARAG